MDRKRFLELPKDARDEILQLQATLTLHRKATDDFCERYRELRRMQVKSSEPHWTIRQLLDLSEQWGKGQDE